MLKSLTSFLGAVIVGAAGLQAKTQTVYVGTYTNAESKGIYAFGFDDQTGQLAPLGLAAATKDPSFLALDPSGRHLYAANEVNGRTGSVTAFDREDGSFKLRAIGRVTSGGEAPCALAVTPDHWLFAANYTSGSIAAVPLDADGAPSGKPILYELHGSGPNAKRQATAHAHCVVPDPTGRFILCCDLGSDKVRIVPLPPQAGRISSFSVPAGNGPRHLLFSRDGAHLYIVNELASAVTVWSWDRDAAKATLIETDSTLPAGWTGNNTAAEIQLSADGRFLYTSNRGHDSLARFPVKSNGTLGELVTVPCGGKTPRDFALDATGSYLLCAAQDSNGIQVFQRDATSGTLVAIGTPARVSRPVFVLFAP